MKELYQQIKEAIEYLLFYYNNLFGLAVEKADIKCEKKDMGKHGIVCFTATVPKTNNPCAYTVQEMKNIMQEYLEICVLPVSQIPPYSVGGSMVEPLYVNSITENEGNYIIEILYIDNATAFRYVKNSKRSERRERS